MDVQPLDYLLFVMPVAALLWLVQTDTIWLFLASALAIVPLAGLMGRATEQLAHSLGAGIGGLLDATFGNAAELILGLTALAHGQVTLVKASITGSIIGNVLLVMGVAIVAGGFRYKKQTFSRTAAGMGTSLLALATIGMLVPAIFHQVVPEHGLSLPVLSAQIAIILATVYLLSLVFVLWTHDDLFAGPSPQRAGRSAAKPWSRAAALVVLLLTTAGVAFMSELLVGSVEAAAHELGLNEIFIGVIIVAVVGNAAEHATAVMAAVKDQMDLAFQVAVGSSIQVALFVVPVLIGASWLLGQPHPLELRFSSMETVSVIFALVATALVAHDGESHWMEGVLLLAVYLILALAFYHLPAAPAAG